MRIIAGSARRVQLEVAADSSARPFLEMARGALFNSLGNAVPGARVLDVYAGSGALGLEALSRGARSCLFVERDPASCRALLSNAERCGLSGRVRVARDDAGRYLAALAAGEAPAGAGGGDREGEGGVRGGGYDLLFLDPPFPELSEWRAGGGREGLMRDASRLLAAGGSLVFRLEDAKVPPPEWPGLALLREGKYGRSRVCRYTVK